MKIYELLENVTAADTKFQMYFFENERDAINTIGGYLICGHVEEYTSYIIANEPFDEHMCDAVIFCYGDCHFLYKIEE